MATLQESAQSILNEKNLKVLPENIVKGITMFGVEGTAAVGGEPSAYYTEPGQCEFFDDASVVGMELDVRVEKTYANIKVGDYVRWSNVKTPSGTGSAMSKVTRISGSWATTQIFEFTPGGPDTSDGTALASDICGGKVAYVNGERIVGTLSQRGEDGGSMQASASSISIPLANQLGFTWTIGNDAIYRKGYQVTLVKSFADVAAAIGLTADKIKKGETILGITGTYEGDFSETISPAEYSEAEEQINDLFGEEETE